MPISDAETGLAYTPVRQVSTNSTTGWTDTVATFRAVLAMQNRAWGSWTRTTSCTSSTTNWPTGWIIDCDTGTGNTTTGTITISGNTAEANAVWGMETWQDCEHSPIRWTPTVYRGAKVEPKSAEELAREAAQREQRRQQGLRKNARRLRFMQAANGRARKLLVQMLNRDQRAELDDKNHFHLTVHSRDGSMRVYRIDYGYAGNVKLLGADGKPARSYCIHSDSRLPYEDQMLAQKLLLESDEKKFLRIANETVIRRAA